MTCVLSPEAWASLVNEKKTRIRYCPHCGEGLPEESSYEEYLKQEFTAIDRFFGHYPPRPDDFKEK